MSVARSVTTVLHDARGDLRHAVRLFARQPAIQLLTIAGLALGLGMSTAAFSLMNAAVLRGEGLADPDRAPGVLRTAGRATSTAWTYDEFLHLREGSTDMRVEGVLTETALVRTSSGEGDAPSGRTMPADNFRLNAEAAKMHARRRSPPHRATSIRISLIA